MKSILEQFEKQLTCIEGAIDELFPPASDEELNMAEQELGINFPDDFRSLYKWRNGQQGILFLFDEFRLYSIDEMLEMNRSGREYLTPEDTKVSDDSGVIKDCIGNPNWIQFGDNGGNTILFLDMDPGKQGAVGQLLEACEGEPELQSNSIKEFLENITNKIASGEIAWDTDAGGFVEMDDESVTERECFKNRNKLIESAPNLEALARLHEGDKVTLVGAIKPNHKTKKHKLYIRGGPVRVTGDIGKINTGLADGPPLVEVSVKVGKKALLGIGAPSYEVISCVRIP